MRYVYWEPLKTGTRADFVHDLYQMLGTKPQRFPPQADNAFTVCISRFGNDADDE